MMYSMDLYYNFLLLEMLGHGLRTMMNTNALKTILLCYSFQVLYHFLSHFNT
jgi:hypothetical protein